MLRTMVSAAGRNVAS